MVPEKPLEFEAHRPRLFGLAYRLLGEATEAQDVLQDAYLRWSAATDVHTPAAWLTTVVTNLCLTRLSSARARRESYPGPWLPEPVLTDGSTDVLGPLETVEQRESVSMGMLVLLERLGPAERAAFVLREAFEYPHADIAVVLGIGEPHARQLYRRARERVRDSTRGSGTSPRHQEEIVRRFLAAALDGELGELEEFLADDAVSVSDGGGEVSAARHPVTGAAKVARLLRGLATHPRTADVMLTPHAVNGEPAVLVREQGTLAMVLCFEVAGDRVCAVRTVLNPGKLAFAAEQLRP